MWWLIFFLAVVFILFAIMIARAPLGYEDEDGFHYGKMKEDDEL